MLIFLALATTKTFYEGQLAKVDFQSHINFTNWSPGWSPDNFGSPSGLGLSTIYYHRLVSVLPIFPFKSLLLYYLFPILLSGFTLFQWITNLFKRQEKGNQKLIAAVTVCFFFNSIIFVGVFLYGWNLLTLIPLAGLAIACRAIDQYKLEPKRTHLAGIAIGSALIGGMIHFLIFSALYAFRRTKSSKQYLILVSILLLGDAYVLIPEIFSNMVVDEPYYQGVDPIAQTRDTQINLGVVDRINGTFDPKIRADWFKHFWIIIALMGLLGFGKTIKSKILPFGFYVAVIFFSALNFSGLFWDVSLNKLWTFVPFIGGMFRNPDKIYIFVAIGIFTCAAYWLLQHNIFRVLTITILLITTSNFYLGSGIKSQLTTAHINLPKSYENLSKEMQKDDGLKRTLLLPFPKWFHFYSWNEGIQTQNILKQTIGTPVISDEIDSMPNIPTSLTVLVKNIYGGKCNQAKSAAFETGITHVVLQSDFQINSESVDMVKKNLEKCFETPFFKSAELLAFRTNTRSESFTLGESNNPTAAKTSIGRSFFGYSVFSESRDEMKYTLKERTSSLSYINFQPWFRVIQPNIDENKWLTWTIAKDQRNFIINLNVIVALLSALISIGVIGIIMVPKSIRRKMSQIIQKNR